MVLEDATLLFRSIDTMFRMKQRILASQQRDPIDLDPAEPAAASSDASCFFFNVNGRKPRRLLFSIFYFHILNINNINNTNTINNNNNISNINNIKSINSINNININISGIC